jgi:hypothetical protein
MTTEFKMGYANRRGDLCLLLEGQRDSGVSHVLLGTGADPAWQRKKIDHELVAVAPALEPAGETTGFAGLTVDGEVIFLDDGDRERIDGAGFGDGSKKLGHMSDLLEVGDQLVALGYGGQAYRRMPRGWRPFADGFPRPEVEGDTIRFAAAAYQASRERWIFGGEVVTGTFSAFGSGLFGAGMPSDATAIANALRAQARKDFGTLWTLTGEAWQNLALPTAAAIDEAICADGEVVYLRARDEVIYTLIDGTLTAIARCKTAAFGAHQGKILVADEDAVHVLTPKGVEPFAPPLPKSAGFMQVLSSAGDALYVIRSESVMRLADGTWREIALPAAKKPAAKKPASRKR